MKFTTFAVNCLSFVSLIKGQVVAPSFVENEANLVERELNVPSLVSQLLDGFDVADIISSIDYEKIAGFANNLLTENNHIEYLDNILSGLKNTEILPDAAVYIVTHNATLAILKETLPMVLSVAEKVNTTSFFVALDRSGLAYSLVAGSLTEEQFLPSVLEIAQKLIKSGGIDFSSLLQQAEQVITNGKRQEFTVYEEIEPFPSLTKRDNIEDLLTTVFSSVERSGLINDTVIKLLTNEEFQDATVVLIQGALQNIGSIITNTDFTALKPILNSLLESGLLQHTLERALQDEGLRSALTSDLASLLKQGTIKQTDLVAKEDTQSVLAMDSALESASSFADVSSYSTIDASSTVDASSSDVSTSSEGSAASSSSSSDESLAASSNVNLVSMVMGLLVPVCLLAM